MVFQSAALFTIRVLRTTFYLGSSGHSTSIKEQHALVSESLKMVGFGRLGEA